MSRSVAINLIASALTILAAVVLLSSAALVGDMTVAVPAASNTEGGVFRFYDAVNELVRTGDSSALDRVVAPDLVVHTASAEGPLDRAGLNHHLLNLHSIAPGLRLAFEDVTVAGDRAIVRVTQTASATVRVLGMPVSGTPAFWGSFDALRFAGGQVVELSGGVGGIPVVVPLGQARLDPLLTPDHAMRWRRLQSEPGADWSLGSSFQSRVLYLEAGELTVTVEPASAAPATVFTERRGQIEERTVRPGASATVRAGDVLALPALARCAFYHEAWQPPVSAYEVAFPRFTFTDPSPVLAGFPAAAVGAAPPALPIWDSLAHAAATGLPQDSLIVSIGRITLPAGLSLTLAETDGLLMLSVEAGTLDIDALRGDTGDGDAMGERLGPGQSTIVPIGAIATLIAADAESVTVLAVTILPSHVVSGAR